MLFFIVILTGCSQQKWLSQGELFEKKQECFTYKDNLQKEIDKSQNEVEKADWYYYERIVEIFYSPTKNSCFAITNERSSRDRKEYNELDWIIDLLSNEKTNYNRDNNNEMIHFGEKIKELKWE